MRETFLILITTALLASLAMAAPSPTGKGARATAGKESPFACDREALDPAARKRHFDELGPMLRGKIEGVRELVDGYEFQFPADPQTVQQVAEWSAGERLCCPFFDIAMRMDREGGPFWLRLTGRKGTKAFIESDGAAWLQAARIK